MTFEDFLGEAIKGWKHAHNDLAKHRREQSQSGNEWHTHALNKSGKESGMHDARKSHASEAAARAHHDLLKKNNPNSHIAHNLYHNGKHVGTM
ncbi:hypothetical protein [Xanthomonas phage BUDD]|nr:hypothetical protein [Xanthomonas phage BUDD]